MINIRLNFYKDNALYLIPTIALSYHKGYSFNIDVSIISWTLHIDISKEKDES